MRPLDEWRNSSTSFDAHGWRIASWGGNSLQSDKPLLLLIHGFPTSSWDWTGVWPHLESRFSIVALDMLGFGLSAKPQNFEYRIADQADLQEIFLERLGAGEAHIFAHDYGVTVAQELLARQSESTLSFSVKSVVFLNGGLYPEHHRARPIQKLALTPFGRFLRLILTQKTLHNGLTEVFGADTPPSNAEIATHWALLTENDGTRIFHKLLNYIPERRRHRDRWVNALSDATMPLCLINGGADPVSGAHLYHAFRENLPRAKAHLLEKIGHYPHTEDSTTVTNLFLEFHQEIGTFGKNTSQRRL